MENIDELQNLKFPIGPFGKKDEYSQEEFEQLISDIAQAPGQYRQVVQGLASESFSKVYRPGSWNIRQLVHHVADIQLLHYFRLKKALTESDYHDVTLIDMDKWAISPDSLKQDVEDSLLMFDGITRRYVYLIRSLTKEQLDIEYFHPVRKFTVNQAQAVAMSAWHVKHHLAHIQLALRAV